MYKEGVQICIEDVREAGHMSHRSGLVCTSKDDDFFCQFPSGTKSNQVLEMFLGMYSDGVCEIKNLKPYRRVQRSRAYVTSC